MIKSLRAAGGTSHLTEAVALQRTAMPRALPAASSPLTPRQHEILAHLAEGLTTHQIARTLELSSNTIASHLQHIYRAIGANNAPHAIRIAMQAGLLH
ncbi:helix-turn-helix transcriptional regulator [Phytomonospora sp. NPDC050363]|uniref:response regulator transcription factor n=1 Tax=Phytomonospora sp. NPDC050363 TaxID=3155642 RepID=UPI0033CE5E3D